MWGWNIAWRPAELFLTSKPLCITMCNVTNTLQLKPHLTPPGVLGVNRWECIEKGNTTWLARISCENWTCAMQRYWHEIIHRNEWAENTNLRELTNRNHHCVHTRMRTLPCHGCAWTCLWQLCFHSLGFLTFSKRLLQVRIQSKEMMPATSSRVQSWQRSPKAKPEPEFSLGPVPVWPSILSETWRLRD